MVEEFYFIIMFCFVFTNKNFVGRYWRKIERRWFSADRSEKRVIRQSAMEECLSGPRIYFFLRRSFYKDLNVSGKIFSFKFI